MKDLLREKQSLLYDQEEDASEEEGHDVSKTGALLSQQSTATQETGGTLSQGAGDVDSGLMEEIEVSALDSKSLVGHISWTPRGSFRFK